MNANRVFVSMGIMVLMASATLSVQAGPNDDHRRASDAQPAPQHSLEVEALMNRLGIADRGRELIGTTAEFGADNAASPNALGQQGADRGTWRDHACTDCVRSIAITADAFWVGTASAGVVRHDRYNGSLQHYDLDNGLGGRTVNNIDVSSSGEVWAGVSKSLDGQVREYGLSHFDGARWRVHRVADGMPKGSIVDIAAGPDGRAWVATSGGFGYFDGRDWTRFERRDGILTGAAQAVGIQADGTLWAGMDRGLAYRKNDVWTQVSMAGAGGNAVFDLALAPDGSVWVAVDQGIAQYDPSTLAWSQHGTGGAPDAPIAGFRIEVDESGTVWAFGKTVQRFDARGWTTIDAMADFYAQHGPHGAYKISVGPDGTMALGLVNAGIAYLEGDAWVRRLAPLGPSNLVALAVTVDRNDDLWVGQSTQLSRENRILSSYDGARWRDHGRDAGMLEGQAVGILNGAMDSDAQGNIWVGVDEAGVMRFDGSSWTAFDAAMLGVTRIYSVVADQKGGAWIGAEEGAIHLSGGAMRKYTVEDGLASDKVMDIAIDHRTGQEAVWMATDRGASRLDPQGWSSLTQADGLASNFVAALAVESNGVLWLGTDRGLSRFDGNAWKTFGVADGLLGQSMLTVAIDPSGFVWAIPQTILSGGGVSRFDGLRWDTFTVEDGLLNNAAFDIAFDREGSAWIATMDGVSEFVPPSAAPPVPPQCVCRVAREGVPTTVLHSALADPSAVSGWRQRLNPSAPASPMNPLRECLTLQSPARSFHPLFNSLIWRAGCP